jgi:hypothetical protein
MNPLWSIKSSCQRVVSDCQFVTINDDAIETAATDMMQQNSFSGNRSVDWDAEGNFVIGIGMQKVSIHIIAFLL